jgi:hypothetical protein
MMIIVLSELIEGPQRTDIYKTVPAEVNVQSVKVDENIASVDFSEEMHTKHWGGAAGESMTINSLVNTLTEKVGKKTSPAYQLDMLAMSFLSGYEAVPDNLIFTKSAGASNVTHMPPRP